MMKQTSCGWPTIVCLALAAIAWPGMDDDAWGGDTIANETAAEDRDLREIGVRDIFGYEHSFGEFLAEPAEAVVLFFCHPDCPVVRQYLPRLNELQRHYNAYRRDRTGIPVTVDSQGREIATKCTGDRVVFLAIYSTPEFSLKEMASHALDERIAFRPLLDPKQELLRAVGGSTLGEVAVLDAKGTLRYRGMADDQYFRGGAKVAAQHDYLREAIDAVRAGKSIDVSRRPPQGCKITPLDTAAKTTKLTFHKDIEPILQKRCQECHRPGMVGPMPLTSFDEVREFGSMVEEVVRDGRMPPWPGESPRHFEHDTRLTKQERSALIDWASGGMPRGDEADAPPSPKWTKPTEWKIGKPDFVYEMPEAYSVPATGVVDYVYYPIKVRLPEDKFITAVETVPGDPSVVHHIQVHEFKGPIRDENRIDLTPVEQLFLYGLSIEGTRLIGNYSPGSYDNARVYDAGQGVRLSRGANLMLELHYTPSGKATRDRSKVGIKFADAPPQRELQTHFFYRKRGDFVIPSNVARHSMQHLYHFEKPVRILGMRPHLHSRATSYRLELVDSRDIRPEDIRDLDSHDKLRGETVLSIPVWDFNWQLTYSFVEPLVIHRGKALLATGYWDNTKHNPRNPDWTQNAPWGLQTHHEMFHTMFLYEELDDSDPAL